MIRTKLHCIILITLTAGVLLYSNQCVAVTDTAADAIYKKFIIMIGTEAEHQKTLNAGATLTKGSLVYSIEDKLKRNSQYSEKEKALFRQTAQKSIDTIVARHMDKLSKLFSFEDASQNVYVPVYKKHFASDEIWELIRFYESGVGKKYLSLSQALQEEISKMTYEKYNDRISKINTETQAEIKKLEQEFDNRNKQQK